MVSRELFGGVLAARIGDGLEAGRLKRRRDVGAGASDKVDNLLDSLGVGEGGANVVVSGLEGVVAGVGGDGGDEAVGDVAGASHAGGNLAESAESDCSIGGGTHDGGLSEETVDVLLGDAVVVVVCSLRGVHGAEHPVEHLGRGRVIGAHPGRENAPESLTLGKNIDDGIGTDGSVDLVGVLEHVLGVEHLELLDDVGVAGCLVTLAVEGLSDERVDLGFASVHAGAVVFAALLRTVVDGVLGVAGAARTEEVGGGFGPVIGVGDAGLGLPEHEVHGQHVLQGLLLNLLLGLLLLDIRRVKLDVSRGCGLR